MKIAIAYTVEVTDTERKAIEFHTYIGLASDCPIASRKDTKYFFRTYGRDNNVLSDFVEEYETSLAEEKAHKNTRK